MRTVATTEPVRSADQSLVIAPVQPLLSPESVSTVPAPDSPPPTATATATATATH